MRIDVITTKEQFNDYLANHAEQLTQSLISKSQRMLEKLEDATQQEFLVPVSEQQLNEAIQKFVVAKVNAILAMHLEIHDGWVRLYATINIKGIFADLAVNLGLVHAQFDRFRQRFVFRQLGDTEVLSLYTDSYLKSKAIHSAIWVFHHILKKDPLGMILEQVKLASQKEDLLYLDLGRWLKNNKKIMSILRKVQVNHGFFAEQQLVLKANANITEVLNLGNNKQLITEADNPNAVATQTVLIKQPKDSSSQSEVLIAQKVETPIEDAA